MAPRRALLLTEERGKRRYCRLTVPAQALALSRRAGSCRMAAVTRALRRGWLPTHPRSVGVPAHLQSTAARPQCTTCGAALARGHRACWHQARWAAARAFGIGRLRGAHPPRAGKERRNTRHSLTEKKKTAGVYCFGTGGTEHGTAVGGSGARPKLSGDTNVRPATGSGEPATDDARDPAGETA